MRVQLVAASLNVYFGLLLIIGAVFLLLRRNNEAARVSRKTLCAPKKTIDASTPDVTIPTVPGAVDHRATLPRQAVQQRENPSPPVEEPQQKPLLHESPLPPLKVTSDNGAAVQCTAVDESRVEVAPETSQSSESPPLVVLPVRPFVRDESEGAQQRRQQRIAEVLEESLKDEEAVSDVTEIIQRLDEKMLKEEEDHWRTQEEERVRREQEVAAAAEAVIAESDTSSHAPSDSESPDAKKDDDADAVDESKVTDTEDDRPLPESAEERVCRLEAHLNQVKERVLSLLTAQLKKTRRQAELHKFKLCRRGAEAKAVVAASPVCPVPSKETVDSEGAEVEEIDDEDDEDSNTNVSYEACNENKRDSLNSDELEELFEQSTWDVVEEQLENELDEIVCAAHTSTKRSTDGVELLMEITEHKSQGNAHFRDKEYIEALLSYCKALLRCIIPYAETEIPLVLGNLSTCAFSIGEYEEAVSLASDALAFNDQYVKGYIRRFRAKEALKSYHDALSDLDAAIKLDPSLTKEYGRTRAKIETLSKEQFEKEKAELLSQLKTFGNWALGKVGLSLDNFKLEQNPDTGAYNIQFVQNQGASSSSQPTTT